jgi:hypothetical protein
MSIFIGFASSRSRFNCDLTITGLITGLGLAINRNEGSSGHLLLRRLLFMRQVAIMSSTFLLLCLGAVSVQAEERQGVPGRRVGGGTRYYQDTWSASWASNFLPTPGTASKSASE